MLDIDVRKRILEKMKPDRRHTILVVEDNEENCEILVHILEQEYDVLTAANGREALEILRKDNNKDRVCVILLDLRMPVMDGYEFLDVVSMDKELRKIPVIITTAYDTLDEELRCLDKGVFDFLGKPYNELLIMTRVRNVIKLKQTELAIAEATLDPLTGCKNRKSYYDDIRKFEAHPGIASRSAGIAFLDINGLKTCNDKDGHDAGDEMIKAVAMKARAVFFDGEIYRLGGDEFVVISFDESEDSFYRKVAELNECWEDGISASVGYVWMPKIERIEEYVAEADKNMYTGKTKYYEQRLQVRRAAVAMNSDSMMAIANEISECMPGGFFTYHAEGNEELIHFNSEVVRMFGCTDKNDFKSFTGNSFRGMVHPDDLALVEQDIAGQIKQQGDLDYVVYRIVCKDGSIKRVRDYGRFVHTELYGNVYYVLIFEI